MYLKSVERCPGGQPGSGKSRSASMIRKDVYPDQVIVSINVDELRDFHPYYQNWVFEDPFTMGEKTNLAAKQWAAMSLDYAIEQRFSVLVEGTWTNSASVLKRAEHLHQHSYEVIDLSSPPATPTDFSTKPTSPPASTMPTTSATTTSTAHPVIPTTALMAVYLRWREPGSIT